MNKLSALLTVTAIALGAIALSVGSAGCGPEAYDYSKEIDPRKHEYVVGVADALRVTVWKNPDLSTEANVRPDGTITLPLIGDIQAAGSTPSRLREAIQRRLSNYIKEEGAAVTIAVTSVNSYHFTVSGNVERGGVFNAKSYVSATEAIALAGGLNRFANPRRLVLIRRDAGGLRRIPLDYHRIASGEHPEEDLVLLAGDTLQVQ